MVKRQFKMVTGLTGLLVATGVGGLLSDHGDGWVGSAYAQDADAGDGTAEMDESSAEGTGDASEGESGEESTTDEGDSGFEEEEESEPVGDAGGADDSERPAGDEEAPTESTDEPVAEEPAEPDPAPPAVATQADPQPQQAPPSQVASKADRVLQVLYRHTREILPDLASHDFKGSDSLRSLGANSIDRSEIVMLTLETLGLRVPMIELAKAENLDELAGLIASKMP